MIGIPEGIRMENIGKDKVYAFDTLFTNNRIQMLKVLMAYVPPQIQRSLAVYIKILELKYTLEQTRYQSDLFFLSENDSDESGTCDTAALFSELMPYCPPPEQEKLRSMQETYQNIVNMQETMQTLQMMKELFPEGEMPDMDLGQIMSMMR